jgi:hypothetical protein
MRFTSGGGPIQGNSFMGYGFENNTAGALQAAPEAGGGPSNTLSVGEAQGKIDTVSGLWSQFDVTNFQTPANVLGVPSGEVSFGVRDDWGDGRLLAREGATSGRYVDHPTQPISGYYRPTWRLDIGSPSATTGALVLPAGDSTTQKVLTDGSITTGTFETTFAFSTTPSSGGLAIRPIQDASAGEFYEISVGGGGTVELKNFSSGSFDGTVASGSWSPDTSEHTVTATRDSSGNWELLFDGSSLGTGTATGLPTEPDQPEIFNVADAGAEVRDVNWR